MPPRHQISITYILRFYNLTNDLAAIQQKLNNIEQITYIKLKKQEFYIVAVNFLKEQKFILKNLISTNKTEDVEELRKIIKENERELDLLKNNFFEKEFQENAEYLGLLEMIKRIRPELIFLIGTLKINELEPFLGVLKSKIKYCLDEYKDCKNSILSHEKMCPRYEKNLEDIYIKLENMDIGKARYTLIQEHNTIVSEKKANDIQLSYYKDLVKIIEETVSKIKRVIENIKNIILTKNIYRNYKPNTVNISNDKRNCYTYGGSISFGIFFVFEEIQGKNSCLKISPKAYSVASYEEWHNFNETQKEQRYKASINKCVFLF